jgi:two-component system response regulator AtoC
LQRYPWPGNVRELENVLERAVILAGGAGGRGGCLIRLPHLPPALLDDAQPMAPTSLLRPGFSIDSLERQLIYEALARTSGNKTEAAKLLGITRRRLYSRLKSIEADTPSEDEPPSNPGSC